MSVTLGYDWENFFDQSFASCRKPLFQKSNSPFFEYDAKTANMKGAEINSADGFVKSQSSIFLEGNANTLT